MTRRKRNPPKRRSKRWFDDPEIMSRLVHVERLFASGASNREIARRLEVDESTIRLDVKRLTEHYIVHIGREQTEGNRAHRIAELREVVRRSFAAAEWDQGCERAVLFGQPMEDGSTDGLTVHRPGKGSVFFRGNKAAALGVARQAIMDIAKLQGLLLDRVSPTSQTATEPLWELIKWAKEQEAAGES